MAKAGTGSAKKTTTAGKAVDQELRKAFDKMRKDFAGLVGEVSRVDADMKRGVEVAKEAKRAVSKLIKDPLVSVPKDLQRQVEALEAKLAKVKTQLADRALYSSLEEVQGDVKALRGNVEAVVASAAEVAETVGDHSDRIALLEDAVTDPAQHAHPPSHPAPVDPRQTTLDDAIERAKTTETPVIDLKREEETRPA